MYMHTQYNHYAMLSIPELRVNNNTLSLRCFFVAKQEIMYNLLQPIFIYISYM